jgi:hypothetical protein
MAWRWMWLCTRLSNQFVGRTTPEQGTLYSALRTECVQYICSLYIPHTRIRRRSHLSHGREHVVIKLMLLRSIWSTLLSF